MFKLEEYKIRIDCLKGMMFKNNIDVVLLVGNGVTGGVENGCFRYFVDSFEYYHIQFALFFRDKDPVVCCGNMTYLATQKALGYADVRMVNERQMAENIINIINEKEPLVKTLGYCSNVLSADWYLKIESAFPGISFIDITDQIGIIRSNKSQEEIIMQQKSAFLADLGYNTIVQNIKVGMTEYEIAAEADRVLRKYDIEDTNILLSRGQFSLMNNKLLCPHYARLSNAVIEKNDCVTIDIGVRYKGYWSRKTRTISLEQSSPELNQLQEDLNECAEKVVKWAIPGKKLKDVFNYAQESLSRKKYFLAGSLGYICGVDLYEYPVEPTSEILLKENSTLFIQPQLMINGNAFYPVWGDTFIITENGGKPLYSPAEES